MATTIQGVTQTTAATAGAALTIQGSTGNTTGAGGIVTIVGGTGGATNANGGNLVLSGGAKTGAGTQGLVTISTSAFTSSTTQSFGSSASLTAGLVDQYSSIPVTATASGVTVTIPAPAAVNQVVGRLLYVANVGVTNDFNILLTGTSVTVALKPNSTATLIWNGNGWTAAGASSATDLQAAYNNTQTSAGGAEIVLRSTLDTPTGTGGLTIRNNDTLPISGGLLEIQSSIGTNLFSVNGYGSELAANGGAETKGVSDITFPASTWSSQNTGAVSRTITSGEFQTGIAGVKIGTTGSNQGARNQLTANPVASTTYTVSFTAASSTAGTGTTPIEVIYSPDNGTTLTNLCQGYGNGFTNSRTISNYTTVNWTKVTCTVTTTGAAVTTPLLIIRQTDATTRTIYVDNLSMIRNDATTRPSSVQIGGGNTGGQVTLFTFDRSSAAPLVSGSDDRYLGSMYYDTTLGNINVTKPMVGELVVVRQIIS
ncbi:hypothetical protein IPL68_04515 [Candidatus Saccharibacteria bacterium]|nr:MAG: hypothetical protein IPL68_04515 [Candidatus Saccharibacteria bacterium]